MSEQQPLLPTDNVPQYGSNSLPEQQSSLRDVLESPLFHKLVLALIVIDACCVLADLSYTFLSNECNPGTPELPAWLEVLANISLAITTIFLFEIPLTLWAFGWTFYNPFGPVVHAALHVFDAIIIITTFLLEVVLKGRERELASLLVVLRLWRLVKLVGGITVGAGEISEEEGKELERAKREMEGLRRELEDISKQNRDLNRRLQTYEDTQ